MNLYGIRNRLTDRIVYIGITRRSVKRRFAVHWQSAQKEAPRTKLHRALKKHGLINFSAELLATASNWAELQEMERAAIVLYRTFWEQGGYNLTHGGDGVDGYKHDPADVRRRAEMMRGKPGGMLGKNHSAETCVKIAAAGRGRPSGMKGKHHTEEIKRQISAKLSGENHPNYGKKRPPEVIEKMREAATGKTISPEARAKISAHHKGKPKSEAHRKALSEAKKGKKFSEEHKASLREVWRKRRAKAAAEAAAE